MNRRKNGFTMVELLTVVSIITILLGLLIPSLSMVRRIANETKQKAQLTAIDMALLAFKDDYGDYPPSLWIPSPPGDYCGAQKLAEALVGWDLLGFHPDSQFVATNHVDDDGVYDSEDQDNLSQRKGPYIDREAANAFLLNDLFDGNTGPLAGDTYVICDSFRIKRITLTASDGTKVTVKAGTPILYYKANPSSKTMDYTQYPYDQCIYSLNDNLPLIGLGKMTDTDIDHPLVDEEVFYSYEGGVLDPAIVAREWPYRPDSYILISAGIDGEYGTGDDICNF